MTREEFLNEMVAYYSEDVSRRSVGTNDLGQHICYYKKNNKCCAIGRYIPDDKYDDIMEGKGVTADAVLRKLPQEIINLGIYFLEECQFLHDGNKYWDTSGLTNFGLEKYNQILQDYCGKSS